MSKLPYSDADSEPRGTSSNRPDHGELDLYGEDLGPGALIGDYVVEEQRSRGGFATVYHAKHCRTGADAAAKILHKSLTHSATMLERFRLEAEAVNRIKHPNIIDVYDHGEFRDGRPYFIMEWLEGRDLEDHLRTRGAMAPNEALAVFAKICEALTVAHAANIVHRDLKASNVVLVDEGDWFKVKLVDFGIAKMLDGEALRAGLTTTGTRLGTSWNMAPEQILGTSVDVRTDVYAAGVLLFHMLTGHLPFRGDTPVEVEEMHLKQPPPKASDMAPVSAAVDAVIARCMQKRREDRYATIIEVLAAAKRVLHVRGAGADAARMTDRAIALHVEIRFGGADAISEKVLNDLDHVNSAVRRFVNEAGMSVALDAGNTLLAIARLPTDRAAEMDTRAHAMNTAIALKQHLDSRDHRADGVSIVLALHAGSVVTQGTGVYVGGDIFDFADWSEQGLEGKLIATTAALRGIESAFVHRPLDTNAAMHEVKPT